MGLLIATVAGVGGWGWGAGVVPEGLVEWVWCTGSHISTDAKMQHGEERLCGRGGGNADLVGWGWGADGGGGGNFRGRFCPVRFVGSFGLAVERVN